MKFCIAASFSEALTRLTAQEQKAVKTTAFDLQMNPASPGLKFHRVDKSKDPNFWSVRVSGDIRVIVHKSDDSILLVYVDHHDAAYDWAERRKIEKHPTTGAMQLVELRERVEDVPVRRAAPPAPGKPKLFANLRKLELVALGVPEEWVDTVRDADEDTLLDIANHLPQEAQEALLRLAIGERPETRKPAPSDANPIDHPDSQRHFRILTNTEELERALESPWEKWAVFLHPDQRAVVERTFPGPARVSGSAGTGKTVVALHRAAHLARRPGKGRVLLTTFSTGLAQALTVKLGHLVGNEAAVIQRIDVHAINDVAVGLYTARFGAPTLASDADIRACIAQSGHKPALTLFDDNFLFGEWNDIVDAWDLQTWEAYRDVARLGRKTRIGQKQREQLWPVFADVRKALAARSLVTWAGLLARLTDALTTAGEHPYQSVVADEAQDLGVPQMRLLAALPSSQQDGLFLAGDLGQRIFQTPFSWKTLSIDVRGRSTTLRVNYRTARQIRVQADRLLPDSISDVDGITDSRRGTISLFDTAPPQTQTFPNTETEAKGVAAWIAARRNEGYGPHEIGVFVRSEAELDRARRAVAESGNEAVELSEAAAGAAGKVSIGTMHAAKGLEFRGVVVMACDARILPLQERIEAVTDESDLEEVYNTERHLLYVACTRARDRLLVTGVTPGSEFLADLAAP